MPYATCDYTCDNCGEVCDNDVYLDYCEDCEQLESELNELKTTQLSEAQERKLEEYERLKTWLLNKFGPLEYGLKPSDFILGLDLVVAKILVDYQYFSAWTDGNLTKEQRSIVFTATTKKLLEL